MKMNNVLIDDRRIKVDFSQSVAKLWNKRRRGEQLSRADGREDCIPASFLSCREKRTFQTSFSKQK